MKSAMTIECPVHFGTGRHSRKELRKGVKKLSAPKTRVPRISRLMALAIKFDQMLKDGLVNDQAELARLGHVTRARLTQIMNLVNLAPKIQEAILFLPLSKQGRDVISERHLRPICAVADWKRQQEMWEAFCSERLA